MKITFIYPDLSTNSQQIHHGIASLSAVLKQEGYQTSLIHLWEPIEEEKLVERITKETPDLIAFSATSNMFPYVQRWARWIKGRMNNILTICGGVHPTLVPEESLGESDLDMICLGEGEYPLLELCEVLKEGKDITKIDNIWVKNNGKIFKKRLRPLIENLDILPYPDRSIFSIKDLSYYRAEGEVFLASRGCPYDCYYCCNHVLKKVYNAQQNYVRFRSVDHVLGEIKEAINHFPH